MPLETKRRTLAHLSVCAGCCCGRTDRGKPEVPVDWLKSTWKARKLAGSVHLTISGCLGPCDLVNVVSVGDPDGTTWVGGLTTHEDYEVLVEWAEACKAAGTRLPLPDRFDTRTFSRYSA